MRRNCGSGCDSIKLRPPGWRDRAVWVCRPHIPPTGRTLSSHDFRGAAALGTPVVVNGCSGHTTAGWGRGPPGCVAAAHKRRPRPTMERDDAIAATGQAGEGHGAPGLRRSRDRRAPASRRPSGRSRWAARRSRWTAAPRRSGG